MSERKPGPVANLLIQGQKFFTDPEHWVSGQSRQVIGMWWWKKTRYCATGWLFYANVDEDTRDDAMSFLKLACLEKYESNYVQTINDVMGHRACLFMYTRAAQLALGMGV